jgi:hypothetical protein
MRSFNKRTLAPLLTLMCLFLGTCATLAESEQRDLLMSMNQALASGKPIFDCACLDSLDRKIVRSWYPPKDGSNRIQIAFKTTRNGEASVVRIVKSSGFSLCDSAAIRAIDKRPLLYVPTGDAYLVFDFDFSQGHPRGTSIVLAPDKQSPPVVFVKGDTELNSGTRRAYSFTKTALNNDGVLHVLDGKFDAAEKCFEEASKLDSSYEPAAHNLKWVRSHKKIDQ